MEYDSVLGQQSISGKNVSLILCVWKPCYVKSGQLKISVIFFKLIFLTYSDKATIKPSCCEISHP